MINFKEALQPVFYAVGTRRPLMDVIYGPLAQELRRQVVSIIVGTKVNKSDKRVQWGNFRKAIFDLTGHKEYTCIADMEQKINDHYRNVFN